jgi:hypothetical protein
MESPDAVWLVDALVMYGKTDSLENRLFVLGNTSERGKDNEHPPRATGFQ